MPGKQTVEPLDLSLRQGTGQGKSGMTPQPETVYLSLGSNLGDRQANLRRAIDLLAQSLQLGRTSSLYDTEPVDNINQPRFLNLVCQFSTELPPEDVLALAKDIERKLGRAPGTHNLPRLIDIDILLYGDRIIETEELTIPHPRLTERAFVLVPLAEIAPELTHPVNGRTVRELLRGIVGTQNVVRLESIEGGKDNVPDIH